MIVNRIALLFLAIGASIAIVACPDAANVDDDGGGTPTPAPQPTPPSTTPTPEPPPASMGVVRQYLPRVSGAEIGDDWSSGETTRTLVLSGNLDDADRTLQVHDRGHRDGAWADFRSYTFEFTVGTCLHKQRVETYEATDTFTLAAEFKADNRRAVRYAEFTLTYSGNDSRCRDNYWLTNARDAPWSNVTNQVKEWHWRAEAANPTPAPAPRPYLPRQSGAAVGNDWEQAGENTRSLKLYGNLDDADRTLQLYDNGYRNGVWSDFDQSALIVTTDARIAGACDDMFSAKSEAAAGPATYAFTLSGEITNRNEPEHYVELTLTYGGFTRRCPDGYRDLYAKDVAPWSDLTDEIEKWFWRAEAVDR